MRELSWALALSSAAACGNVAVKADANADAPDPDALVCTAPQLACGSTCVNPMTDVEHCGACDVACVNGVDCLGGHCTDTTASCFAIKQFNPAATDGPYTHKLDGTKFYCDMTNMMQYDALALALFTAPPAGFTQVTAADLQNPASAAGFIGIYNLQTGVTVPTAFSSTNCCLKNDLTPAGTVMLFLAGMDVYPALNNVKMCSPAGGYLAGTIYQIVEAPDTAAPNFANAPLPANYFTMFPASATAGCSANANPALFWKRHP